MLAWGQVDNGVLALAILDDINGHVEVGLSAVEAHAVYLHGLGFDSYAQQQEQQERQERGRLARFP